MENSSPIEGGEKLRKRERTDRAAMLSMQLNDAKRRKAEKRKEVEAMRTRATKASAVLTNALWREVNDGGLQVCKNVRVRCVCCFLVCLLDVS